MKKKDRAYFRGKNLVIEGPIVKLIGAAAKVCGVTPAQWVKDVLLAVAKVEAKNHRPTGEKGK